MKQKLLVLIFFLISFNFLFAQKEALSPILLLKADSRAITLQPKLSLELFFLKKFSIEAGGCRFWTGQKFHQENPGEQGLLFYLLGVGPAKGYDLFSDVKYSWSNGAYVGLGYMYRYSYFKNARSSLDVGENQQQYYKQSEKAYAGFVRTTVGINLKFKNKNLYINPYGALMIGASDLQLDIDTTGGKPANYYHEMKPVHEHRHRAQVLLQVGCDFGFDFFPGRKKRKEEKLKYEIK